MTTTMIISHSTIIHDNPLFTMIKSDVGIVAMLEVGTFELGSTWYSEATLKSADFPS